MNSAVAARVGKVVVLSTDKAVYPINAMGISKAMMEKLMMAKTRLPGDIGTVICGTRYGNVLASRGSVIPLFISQIKAGRPLTVTDPQMTRFMMSIEDAVNLVYLRLRKRASGRYFVQKAPQRRSLTIAEGLKKIFKTDCPIKIIGTRHGEKLYETLLTSEEMARAADLGRHFRIPADTRDLNYGLYFTEGEEKVSREQDYNSHNTRRMDLDEIVELLSGLDIVREELKDGKVKRVLVTGAARFHRT